MCVIDFIRGKSVKVKWKDDIKKKGQSLWIVPSEKCVIRSVYFIMTF